jgi:hypothetical protein
MRPRVYRAPVQTRSIDSFISLLRTSLGEVALKLYVRKSVQSIPVHYKIGSLLSQVYGDIEIRF